jgi:hypothetical protein
VHSSFRFCVQFLQEMSRDLICCMPDALFLVDDIGLLMILGKLWSKMVYY